MSFFEIYDPEYDNVPLPSTFPHYCMIDVRCALCRFRYEQNDLITTLCPAGKLAPEFRFRGLKHTILYNEFAIHMCGRSICIEGGPKIYTFHQSCFAMAPEYFYSVLAPAAGNIGEAPDSDECLAFVAYGYRPSFQDENLRRTRIRDAAAAKLRKGVLKRLPLEIIRLVVDNLVTELAALYSQDIFTAVSSPPSSEGFFKNRFKYRLDLTKDIYVSYRDIEGVEYVQWISNTNLIGKGRLFYKAQEHKKLEALYVAVDFLGVRRVFLEQPPDTVDMGPGSPPYWITVEPDENMLLRCIHDGLKMRRIADNRLPDTDHDWAVAWPTINPAYKRLMFNGEETDWLPHQMKLLECQGFDVDGYCAYLSSSDILIGAVAADMRGNRQDILALYNSLSYGDWIYMPLDQEEQVEDIWLVRFENWGSSSLMLVTNFGRASMFGSMGEPNSTSSPSFLRVFSRSCGPASQFYLSDVGYSVHNSMVQVLGVDKKIEDLPTPDAHSFVRNIKPEWDPYPPSLQPTAIRSPPSLGETFFTKCRLENVISVTCCVNQDHIHKPIVGIMMHYQGGGRACLGHYRHDWAQPPLPVIDPDSTPLVITMYRDSEPGEHGKDKKGRFILGVSVGDAHVKSTEGGDLRGENVWKTLNIPWFGSLEWWFGNVVHYNGCTFFQISHVT